MTTFSEYLDAIEEARRSHPNWREGQAAFNTLCSANRALAESIRGTELDPFYRDERLSEFYENVDRHWEAS